MVRADTHNLVHSIFNELFYQRYFRAREDRNAIKVEEFILDKLKDTTIYRLPGTINGQQFISMFFVSIYGHTCIFILF
jgi:hypothetical protein